MGRKYPAALNLTAANAKARRRIKKPLASERAADKICRLCAVSRAVSSARPCLDGGRSMTVKNFIENPRVFSGDPEYRRRWRRREKSRVEFWSSDFHPKILRIASLSLGLRNILFQLSSELGRERTNGKVPGHFTYLRANWKCEMFTGRAEASLVSQRFRRRICQLKERKRAMSVAPCVICRFNSQNDGRAFRDRNIRGLMKRRREGTGGQGSDVFLFCRKNVHYGMCTEGRYTRTRQEMAV